MTGTAGQRRRLGVILNYGDVWVKQGNVVAVLDAGHGIIALVWRRGRWSLILTIIQEGCCHRWLTGRSIIAMATNLTRTNNKRTGRMNTLSLLFTMLLLLLKSAGRSSTNWLLGTSIQRVWSWRWRPFRWGRHLDDLVTSTNKSV